MFNKSVEYIYSLERNKGRYTLDFIKEFLEKMGNPQNELKCIHVAGTNGKGSTCAMINQGLIEAGYKVGFFSSPHLVRFNERIRVNNVEISDEDLDRFAEELKRLQKDTGIDLSFFEAAVVIAYLYFKEQKVDYVVFEVGLGGRLDATVTCNPIICAITSISRDHMHMLGETVEEIAEDKAGIIKKNVKVVTSAKDKALEIIERRAFENECSFVIAGDKDLELGLKGKYQKENGSLAFSVLWELGINEEAILRGLKNVKWPGRFDFIEDNVLVDCAHNLDGVKKLVESVDKEVVLVFGVCEKKEYEKMLKELDRLKINKRIFSKSKVSSALDPKKLKELYPDAVVIEDVKEALEYAKQFGCLVLVCGSIYLVGELYL